MSQVVPVFIAKRAKGGTSWRGADNYDSEKAGAFLLATNLEGRTPRERSREIAQLRGASSLKRAIDHWSLSLDPRLGKLSEDQWREAARIFLDDMGYRDRCAFTLTRHTDEPQDHAHLLVCRIRTDDLSVVSDSHDFKRSHVAAAKCAEALGLKPLPPREDARSKPAPRDAQVRASKRALRRGTATPVHVVLVGRMRLAVDRATSPDDLVLQARELGLELELVRRGRAADAPIQGLKVRPIGVEEWSKASDLDRDLGWSKVLAKLEQNTGVRDALKARAEVRQRRLDERRARLGKQKPVTQGEIDMSANRSDEMSKAGEDLLGFLDGHQVADHRQVPAAIQARAEQPPTSVLDEREERRRQRQQEAIDADAEVSARLREVSNKTLVWLRSADRDLPSELALEATLERMLVLLVRVITLGQVTLQTPALLEVAARQQLASRAGAEIQRRRDAAQDAVERRKTLHDQRAAVEHRRLVLSARATAAELARGGAPNLHERAFDAKRVVAGLPTLAAARTAHRHAVEQVLRVEADKPKGLGLLRLQSIRAWRQRLAKAEDAKAQSDDALQAVLLAFEAAQRAAQAEADAEAKAKSRADRVEMAALEAEAEQLDRDLALPERHVRRQESDAQIEVEDEEGAAADLRRRDRQRDA